MPYNHHLDLQFQPRRCAVLTLKTVSAGGQVITDPISTRSKGYGFVRFGNEQERDRALTEMAGHIISNRPVRVSIATAKKSAPAVHSGAAPVGSGAVPVGALLGDMDPSNTTLFIGGLNAAVRTDSFQIHFVTWTFSVSSYVSHVVPAQSIVITK